MNSDKLLIIDKILCFTAGGIMEELPLTCVIIGVTQLHAGGMILVERAASHPSSSDRQAVQGCGLLDSDGFLYDFKKIHLYLANLASYGQGYSTLPWIEVYLVSGYI